MSVSADTLRRLADLRLDTDQMAGVLAILADFQGADEARRERQRDRTRRHRDAKRDGNVTVTGGVTLPPPKKKGLPSDSPLKKNTPSRLDDAGVREVDFDSWYASYPHKVGKAAALKAYLRARKEGADKADLIVGLASYVRTKPSDRPWCNPATWLNQKRWLDAPAPEPARRPARTGPIIDHSPNDRGPAHGFRDNDAHEGGGGMFAEQAALRRRQFAERRNRGEGSPP